MTLLILVLKHADGPALVYRPDEWKRWDSARVDVIEFFTEREVDYPYRRSKQGDYLNLVMIGALALYLVFVHVYPVIPTVWESWWCRRGKIPGSKVKSLL
jgi:hypothetical protein